MRIPGRFVWLAAFALSVGLVLPAGAGAAMFDSNDIYSLPTRDVDIVKLSKHRARITLDGVTHHGTVISTDGKEKPQALSVKRFSRDFRKLGLGRHPELRITTRGAGRKFESIDFRLGKPRYDRVHESVEVMATTQKANWQPPKLASVASDAAPGVTFSGNFNSPDGPITINYAFDDGYASFSTVVSGDGLDMATVSLMQGGAVAYSMTLFDANAAASFGPVTFGDGTTLGAAQYTFTSPAATTIGSVNIQSTISYGGATGPFSEQIASWSDQVL